MFTQHMNRHNGMTFTTLAATPSGALHLGALEGLLNGFSAVRDRVGARSGLRLADALGSRTCDPRRSASLAQLHLGHETAMNSAPEAQRCLQRSTSEGCPHVAF